MTDKWTHCYRMRPYFRSVGLLVILFFGGMTIVSLIAWWGQPPNDPVKMPFVVAMNVLFTLLGVYLILTHSRYRLFFGESTIRQTGVFRDNQVDLKAVDELKWRCFPQGGSVVMTGRTNPFKIELGNFERADRYNIIKVLRQAIAEPQQIGWQQFDDQFSDTPEKQRRANRIYFLLVLLCGGHAVAFGVMWAIGFGMQYLVFSGINAVMVMYMVWTHRRKQAKHGDIVGEIG